MLQHDRTFGRQLDEEQKFCCCSEALTTEAVKEVVNSVATSAVYLPTKLAGVLGFVLRYKIPKGQKLMMLTGPVLVG